MTKNENELMFHDKASAISDYPDLISDATVTMAAAKLVPDLVPAVDDNVKIEVLYGGAPLRTGAILSRDDAEEEPDISIGDHNGTYTLMMVDPDAPSPDNPKYRSWLHWMVINIPGMDVHRGQVVEPYMGPAPPKGRHRYAFLLYKQQAQVTAHPPAKRQGFQVREFAKQHGLPERPAAATFFFTQAGPET